MKSIRNGIFMHFQGHELALTESRIEVPIPLEQRTYQLWYTEGLDCPLEGFEKSPHNGFFRTIGIDQVKDVFYIRTFGLYQNHQMEIFPSINKDKIQIATRNRTIASELGCKTMGDDWYQMEIDYLKLDLVWEESIQVKYSQQRFGQITWLNDLMQKRLNQLKYE